MTTVDYAALLNAAEKATAGKWTLGSWRDNVFSVVGDVWTAICRIKRNDDEATDDNQDVRDAAFIVAAQPSTIIQVCADRKALLDRIEALENALRPFGEAAEGLDANDDYSSASIWENSCALDITVGNLREARRVLARSTLSGERGE